MEREADIREQLRYAEEEVSKIGRSQNPLQNVTDISSLGKESSVAFPVLVLASPFNFLH